MQQFEAIAIELEAYPGALCRVRLDDGLVRARNKSAATILGDVCSLQTLIGASRYAALCAEAARTHFWGESTSATAMGRIRLRLRPLPEGGDALVDLELQPSSTRDGDLEALVDMVGDARWEWDLREGRAEHTGTGVMRSGIQGGQLPATPVNVLDLMHPDDQTRAERTMTEYLQGRSPRYRDEFRIRDESVDGWRWVLSRGRAVERDAYGLPLRVVGLITDISRRREREAERARLESQLRHVQKLDALGQLTGGIAHDFNNILASVLGYAELGIMALAGSSEQVTGYLREVRSAADRGRELIAKMLLFSRGQTDPDGGERMTPVSMIEDTVRMLRPMLPATLTVDARIEPGLAPLAVESTQLQQLVLNLTINARDAVGENGRVRIDVTRSDARRGICASCGSSFNLDDGFIALSVHDDGPGIPDDILDNVFDPFFSTKETGRGSGLGLSVVHGIVHEQGGHIDIATSDEGTMITLLLPESSEHPRPLAPLRRALLPDGHGRRVLVIDDEPSIGRWMAELLELRGFVVDVYDDPRTALGRFELTPEHWDLLITDQSMPGLSGVELADEVLARNPDVPIVICSGFSEFVEAGNAMDLGFSAFLDKPVSGDDLLVTIGRVLEAVPEQA